MVLDIAYVWTKALSRPNQRVHQIVCIQLNSSQLTDHLHRRQGYVSTS